jgi:hypothetical protein
VAGLAAEARFELRAQQKNEGRERSRPFSIFVIPGRAKREPGIHNHGREYGFRACTKRRIPE